ncbi:MAG: ATP-binding cassette domain-containing protein, partial [Solirubrobacteraceae bacterium]
MSVAAPQSLIGCRGVRVSYGSGDAQVLALDGVDFRAASGERVALWGPSGSGKTTLLHALGGLVLPTSGAVMWKGEELSSLDAASGEGDREGGGEEGGRGAERV